MIAQRRMDRPEPGFWLVRLAKGAPQVPACIRVVQTLAEPGDPLNLMDRSPFIAAFIAGEPVRMLRRGPGGREPLAVQVGETLFALRLLEAQCIRVRELEASPA